MKALVGSITFGLVLLLTAGCEGGWQFGGSSQNWNESGNWMDVSGLYSPAGKNLWLVSDYSVINGAATASATLFVSQADKTFYTGVVDVGGINASSVAGFIGDFGTFSVSNTGVVGGGASGSINLTTGAFGISIGTPTTNVEYRIVFSRTDGSGGTGIIQAFQVTQSGNKVSFMDNLGCTYAGNLGLVSTNSLGTNAATSATYSFDVAGVSQAGFNVEMVGQFVVGATNQMTGTWLEQGGKTGHILGVRE